MRKWAITSYIAAYLLSSMSLLTANELIFNANGEYSQIHFEQEHLAKNSFGGGCSCKKMKKKILNQISKLPSQAIIFNAFSFTPITSTGASVIDSSAERPFPVVEFPEVSVFTAPANGGPTADLAFEIPLGFDNTLSSLVNFSFLTTYSSTLISGDVNFIVQAEILRADGSSEVVTLGDTTITSVESASLPTLGTTPVNRYQITLPSLDIFTEGDFVVLSLVRNNALTLNFDAPVYLPTLQFVYNIRQKNADNGG